MPGKLYSKDIPGTSSNALKKTRQVFAGLFYRRSFMLYRSPSTLKTTARLIRLAALGHSYDNRSHVIVLSDRAAKLCNRREDFINQFVCPSAEF